MHSNLSLFFWWELAFPATISVLWGRKRLVLILSPSPPTIKIFKATRVREIDFTFSGQIFGNGLTAFQVHKPASEAQTVFKREALSTKEIASSVRKFNQRRKATEGSSSALFLCCKAEPSRVRSLYPKLNRLLFLFPLKEEASF